VTWVKICGITNLEDALLAVDAGADAVGFVFYDKSPRKIDVETARDIIEKLPAGVEKVGVFVGEPQRLQIARRAGLSAMQIYIHASERTASDFLQARDAGVDPFKKYLAMPMRALVGGQVAEENIPPIDFLGRRVPGIEALFLDSGSAQQPGGTGKVFDWMEATPAVKMLSCHYKVVVAGGLRPENVAEAISILKPWGVDVASGVEARPGKKDPEKVRAFVAAVRGADFNSRSG
jgi:phosphoribosylanthranilate isomerase